MKIINFFRSLRILLREPNANASRFTALQTKLDEITSSHSSAATSIKNLEKVIEKLTTKLPQDTNEQKNSTSDPNKLLISNNPEACPVCVTASLNQFYSDLGLNENLIEETDEVGQFSCDSNEHTENWSEPEDISIVMPIYNHEETLVEALESVLMQEMPYSSVIYCLNDASTDKSAAILAEYSKKYPEKIKVFNNPHNLGSGRSSIYFQNPPIRGKYWCILEGDDYWVIKDKLAKQVAFLDAHPDFIGCSGHTLMKNEMTNEETVIKPDRNTWNLLDLMLLQNKYAFYVHTSSILWRNIYLKNGFFLPPAFREAAVTGDVFLAHLMLSSGGKMHAIPEIMSCYRVTGRGLWSRKSPDEQLEYNSQLMQNINRYIPSKYNLLSQYHAVKNLIPAPINE